MLYKNVFFIIPSPKKKKKLDMPLYQWPGYRVLRKKKKKSKLIYTLIHINIHMYSYRVCFFGKKRRNRPRHCRSQIRVVSPLPRPVNPPENRSLARHANIHRGGKLLLLESIARLRFTTFIRTFTHTHVGGYIVYRNGIIYLSMCYLNFPRGPKRHGRWTAWLTYRIKS